MEAERNKLVELIFPNGYSTFWESNLNFNDYLKKLGKYNVEELNKEPFKLSDDKRNIQDQTQDLASSNYKTFIETAQCSRELISQFNNIETKVDTLLDRIPNFEKKCEQFRESSSGINNLRKLNSLTLTRNVQLIEILELPQLMTSFINDGLYEDALELANYVRKLYAKHSDIPIFKSITDDVNQAWLLMLHQLLNQLRNDLSLPKCLQIVGYLRRMEVFTEFELRLKFLHARDHWLQTCLQAISKDVNQHLSKTIEVTRVNLFNIITQYRAIFNDDEHSPLSIKNQSSNETIFFTWINDKISEFLKTLESDLNNGVSSVESIMGQCMYFGLSFSKVGCDFRSKMVPIFTNKISKDFQDQVIKSVRNFEKNIECFTLINKNHSNIPWKSKNDDPLQPPDSLLEFYPLAEFLNNVLIGLNALKQCPPIAIIGDVVKTLEDSLMIIAKSLLILYGQEQQAFTVNSKEAFARLCTSFAYDLVPYIQKCVHIIFPPAHITAALGISIQNLQDQQISFLDKSGIVEPIKHLLPEKIEPEIISEKRNDSENSLIETNSEKDVDDIVS